MRFFCWISPSVEGRVPAAQSGVCTSNPITAVMLAERPPAVTTAHPHSPSRGSLWSELVIQKLNLSVLLQLFVTSSMTHTHGTVLGSIITAQLSL